MAPTLRGPQFTAQPVPAALVWEGEECNLHVCKRGPREVGWGARCRREGWGRVPAATVEGAKRRA